LGFSYAPAPEATTLPINDILRRIARLPKLSLCSVASSRRQSGATHFLMKTLPKVAGEMALHVLAYNLTRVMNIVGVRPLMAAIAA
jgi:hypothetical protein